tara:strand:+ start:80 stop:394 length:315 start_codon:yes stop_codon:yes gene_type:complete
MNLIYKTTPDSILNAVSHVSGYSTAELTAKGHAHTISQWRQLGIYAARRRGLTLVEAGKVFGRHFTTAIVADRKIMALVEDTKVGKALDAINNFIDEQNSSHGD